MYGCTYVHVQRSDVILFSEINLNGNFSNNLRVLVGVLCDG